MSFTGVRETASLLKSARLFSIFWQIPENLKSVSSRFFLRFSTVLTLFQIIWGPTIINIYCKVAGVLQGDTLAPYLFIICLDYVLRTSIDKIKENGFELTKKRSRRYPATTITDADYADDIAILANTPDQAETLLHSLERAAASIGLYVNAHKTEYMCYNQTGDISTLEGTPLKLVDKFTYLGSSVESTEKDIETRLTKAWTAINRLSIIWKSDLTDKMKRSFFQAAVTSILLYGCTTWTLTKRLEKKLDGNYTRMLRAILNKSWQQHPTRHQLYGHLPPITKTIQVKRCTLMDPHTWPRKSRTTSSNVHSAAMWGYRMLSWRTYLGRWTIGRSGERGSGISVLPARYDDDDDDDYQYHRCSAVMFVLWQGESKKKKVNSFLQAAVVSILLYGCTTWTLTKQLEKKLDGNYTRMLRAILNESWWQHPTKHHLYGHLPPITKTIQVRRARHAGHCWRSRGELISDVLQWTPHMDELKQDNQQEHIYCSYVRIRDVALRTCQRRLTIGKSGERGSGISVLAARHDDDDDDAYMSNQRLIFSIMQCWW